MERPGTEYTKKDANQTKKDRFIKAYRSNLFNISRACTATGIGRTTFYRWVNSDEDFQERLDAAKEEKIDFAESALFEKIKKGDTIATIFFLKTIGKSRGYIEQQNWRFEGGVKNISKEHRDSIVEAALMSMQSKKIVSHQNDSDSTVVRNETENIKIEYQE